ncbi:MAG: hypothetical protein QF568_01710 [Flavobacteriales bacterium]|jgi:hypothetical protein|nr:hypothetical protein [Flavobacteriales bacterium]|tara:strand:+ start:86 stop:607 length:522 start_codon:yes stop_codon:yes gene_type:complete
MKPWLHKIELLVDRIIPYTLILLLFLIIGQIFFGHEIEPYHIYVSIIDGFIILIFVLDLIFKYIRTRNFPKFLRKYWLEVIAVFPAFLVLRLLEEFVAIANLGETAQTYFREALEVEKEGKVLVREIERSGKEVSRLRFFSRFIRPLARSPRFLKAFSFYEKPTGKHHGYEKR